MADLVLFRTTLKCTAESKNPPTKWWVAARLFNQRKNGVSANEIDRQLGLHAVHGASHARSPERTRARTMVNGGSSRRGRQDLIQQHQQSGEANNSAIFALVERSIGHARVTICRLTYLRSFGSLRGPAPIEPYLD